MASSAFLMEVSFVHDDGSLSYGQALFPWHRQPFSWKCFSSMTMAAFPMEAVFVHDNVGFKWTDFVLIILLPAFTVSEIASQNKGNLIHSFS